MIPLRVPVRLETPESQPFVVRLGAGGDIADAPVAGVHDGAVHFHSRHGYISIDQSFANGMIGDVGLVDPALGVLHRWIRASSHHNSLLVTERCDQLCVMCSQPPRKSHTDLFAHFETACKLAPANAVIGISGGEPTLFKRQLFDLIRVVSVARPDIKFHVLSNAQHFSSDDITVLGEGAFRNVLWGIPLYADVSEVHDAIVAKPGAHENLCEGLSLLALSGQAIELRTVILQANYSRLPQLSRFVVRRLPFIATWAIMQAERIGFAKSRWDEIFIDHSCRASELLTAVAVAAAHGVGVSLYNFPHCTVPASLRPYTHRSISDWKQRYANDCASCSAQSLCCGFFEWNPSLEAYGIGGPI